MNPNADRPIALAHRQVLVAPIMLTTAAALGMSALQAQTNAL